jgi:hypothetical protein
LPGVGTYIVDKIADTLDRAGQQSTCLEIRLGYPPGANSWFPLGLALYTGTNCRD